MAREEEQKPGRFVVGDWQADPARDVLVRADESVKLEPKTMEVLVFFAGRPGEVVTQSELEAAVWRDVVVTSQSLYQSIAQLRRVLGDDARQPRYIETVPRRGYRLIAPVRWLEHGIGPAMTPTALVSHQQPGALPDSRATADRLPPPPAQPRRHRWALATGALLLAAVVTGAAFLHRPSPTAAPRSIAVTTFVNKDADSSYLAEAITEELVNALGQVDGLRVVARNSARAAQAINPDPREIAERLAVTHVLEGSVRRVDGHIRVMATLVDGRTGYQEWSRSFERPAVSLLRMPTEIAGTVAQALRLVLVGDAGVGGSRIGTRNPTAYDYYILGQQRAAERTAFGLAEAERYFQQATEADAEFAAAYAALADVYLSEHFYANRAREEAFELAAPLLQRALELDPRFGPARALQGMMTLESGDAPRAAQELAAAAELAPNHARTQLLLGGAWFAQGQLERALAAFDRGIELDPLNFILHGRRAVLLQSMGRPAAADASVVRAVTLAPMHPNPRWVLALLAGWRGDTSQTIAHYESALVLAPDRSDLRLLLGQSLLDDGRTVDARRQFGTAATRSRGSSTYLEAVAWQAIAAGTFDELPALAESLASVDSSNLYNLRTAAGFMLLGGEAAKSIPLYERAIEIGRDATLLDLQPICGRELAAPTQLAAAYAATGRANDAQRLLHEFERFLDQAEERGLRCWGMHYQRASIAALRGLPEDALVQLEAAAKSGWRRTWWMRIDPALRSLQQHPGFQSLQLQLTGT